MGKRSQIFRRLSLGAVIGLWAGAGFAAECREDQVHLRGDWGTARFTVEVADDRAERNQGLMFRKSMARSAGMLFVYPSAKPVSFWMKNTYIPLDILFANGQGEISQIHHMAEPLSTAQLYGGKSIQYVLEINGGLAKAMGIAPGTQIFHPAVQGEGCDQALSN
ncbi:DUF192 domain-containing protein [Roseovarius sp. C7]|uniref:DUF192 domain-containing protein n=1 Tax=Roseovarius sp. C7 TaxID=3398643 RepID=UPI0039F593C5